MFLESDGIDDELVDSLFELNLIPVELLVDCQR